MVWVINTVILLLVAVSCSSAMHIRSQEDRAHQEKALMFLRLMEQSLITEIRNFTATGYRSKIFDMWSSSVPYYVEMTRVEVDEYPIEKAIIGCLACRTFLASLLSDRRNGAPIQQLADSAVGMCQLLMPFDPHVCRGLVDLNAESLVFIIDSNPSLTAVHLCGLILQGDCGAVDPMFNFNVNVQPHNQITAPKSVSTPRNPDELRIIHVSDLHYDENYLPGGITDCPNPVCCRRSDGVSPNPATQAGPWGDYRCYAPWQAFEQTLLHIRSQHSQIDMIYHTGDMKDHGIWETTEVGNRRVFGRIFDLFKHSHLSRHWKSRSPTYKSVSLSYHSTIKPLNHISNNIFIFAPSTITRPSLSTRWLYDFMANEWQRHGWISGNAVTTLRSGGYYTVLVRPGFRIIALNNNDCYIYNWWALYSRTEIQSAMQWFHNTLLAAEQANERVHILAHIPTGGGSCFQFWSRQYRRIIDRFHMIIGAQFNGHSHRDEFEIYYDVATATHAVNVGWNGGSTTAYTDVNPNYKLYFVDRVHYQVNEAESYIYSISEASRNPLFPPRWFRQYSFREAFGITNTSPAGLDQLAFNISRNRNMARRFFEYKVNAGDPHMQTGCADDCLRNHICSLVSNEHGDNRRCNQVLSVFGTVA